MADKDDEMMEEIESRLAKRVQARKDLAVELILQHNSSCIELQHFIDRTHADWDWIIFKNLLLDGEPSSQHQISSLKYKDSIYTTLREDIIGFGWEDLKDIILGNSGINPNKREEFLHTDRSQSYL